MAYQETLFAKNQHNAIAPKVQGINASKHKSGEFAFTIIFIPGFDKEGLGIYASIRYKLYLVDRLKANMLVGNNVLYMGGIVINLSNVPALIHSYGMKIDISARHHSKSLRQKVLANSYTLVSPQSEALIAFQHIHLPNSHNFLFHLSFQQYLTLYSQLLDYTNTKILVCNNANHVI